jgi:hypothetical protein
MISGASSIWVSFSCFLLTLLCFSHAGKAWPRTRNDTRYLILLSRKDGYFKRIFLNRLLTLHVLEISSESNPWNC